jgi:hypothetical protein
VQNVEKQDITAGVQINQLEEFQEHILSLQVRVQDYEEFYHDVLDLMNQLEPGALVDRSWTERRDKLIAEFMKLANLPVPAVPVSELAKPVSEGEV